MTLGQRLARAIAAMGPMSVAEFMTAALHDPQDGYYARRPWIGEDGDFITAPQVSQMFGELLGAWAAETWMRMGAPRRVRLVELGPGTGILMEDALRAARAAPGFLEAAHVVLIESSAPLRAAQQARPALSSAQWMNTLDGLDAGAPLIVIANEFLDCLPLRQYVRQPDGWAERVITCGDAHRLTFAARPASPLSIPAPLAEAPLGATVEVSEAQTAVVGLVAAQIAAGGGAALFIDYGRDAPAWGDTLQALRRHTKVDPLEEPGSADLTAHVDFPACVAAARAQGACVLPVTAQGVFLRNLGLDARTRALASGRKDLAARLLRQRRRLADPEEMGELFKVLCVCAPGLEPPGFETQDWRPDDLDGVGPAL